jgi:hypothetical protein
MLSWNEIRHRSIGFSREWRDTSSEKSESQSFWNDFFDIFGIKRRTVASFEEPVKKLSGNWGKIDLFWPGRVLIEHAPPYGLALICMARFTQCTHAHIPTPKSVLMNSYLLTVDSCFQRHFSKQ